MNAQTIHSVNTQIVSIKDSLPHYEKATQSVAQLFGLTSEAAQRTYLETYTSDSNDYKPFVPVSRAHFFEADCFNDLREFEASGYKDGALFITGPKGIGKSTTVEQYYSRMNKPVFRVSGHERLEVSDLIGNMYLKDGKTEFSYGPLTLAALTGGIFLFDEADACPPEVLVGLHGILEMGHQFVIPENNSEIIPMKQGFRVIVTGNTAGGGDMNGEFAGTVIQNSATMDRFNFLQWNYPPEAAELAILKMALGNNMPDVFLKRMIEAANLTRTSGSVESISIRALIRWVRKIQIYGAAKPLKYTFDRAFAFRLSEVRRSEVYAVMKGAFGEVELFVKPTL
jgi:cobaltochelatase CobS